MEATTCVRGFSNTFVPDKKIEVVDFQFIEGGELERTWKQARRQRLKQQEEKIWAEFMEKEDVVASVLNEDRYQFIEHVPEDCLKQLIETEVNRVNNSIEDQKRGAGDSPRHAHATVTFEDNSGDELFQIFDDKDDDLSIIEDDGHDSLDSPCTVREREDSFEKNRLDENRACGASLPATTEASNTRVADTEPTGKESETNMANMIESSIYCAKLKDLRDKIRRELMSIISSLEIQNVSLLEPTQLRNMCIRAGDYANRFNRVHLYHLQRQVQDVKRHGSQALPFAKHTQFQSQMTRIVALHHATLHALQAFHKSFESTGCLRECADQLLALCLNMRQADEVCRAVPVPSDFTTARDIYMDNLPSTVVMVENCVRDYVARATDFILAAENARLAYSQKTPREPRDKHKNKRKSIGSWSRAATKTASATEANARLSMYSMETVSVKQKAKKSKFTKEAPKITNKELKDANVKQDSGRQKKKVDTTTPRSHRKTPRGRVGRPLMRDPHHGRTPRPRLADTDIQTMVENVDPPSSRGEASPLPSPRRRPPAGGKAPVVPPLRVKDMPSAVTPRQSTKRISPYISKTSPEDGGEPPQEEMTFESCMSPVSKIQCAKKEPSASGDVSASSHKQERTKSARSGPDSSPDSRGSSARDKRKPCEADLPNNEVTRLLRQLCGGDALGGGRGERYSGAKNAQLLCMNASSPRTPSTPQLLRILEETIQKKVPKCPYGQKSKGKDKLQLTFNIPPRVGEQLFQYRTKFVQHMLASSMYANSAVGKPWEMISNVSERILDELILKCAKEMEVQNVIKKLYKGETQGFWKH